MAQGRVIDFVGGLRDLKLREVRTIGDPEIRLREDPVRILRAVRFACRLDFDIESRTYAAMEGAVEDIPRCAPPRLLEDTFRILRGGVSAGGLHLLSALDALRFLLPPVDAWLKERGTDGAALLRAHAERLDARVRSGAVPRMRCSWRRCSCRCCVRRLLPRPPAEGQGADELGGQRFLRRSRTCFKNWCAPRGCPGASPSVAG